MIKTAAVTITDDAITNRPALLTELIPLLRPHPVPQSDARTRGFLVQFRKETAQETFQHLPLLYGFLQAQVTGGREYLLALNQTPPTNDNDFAMRPHVDRKWEKSEFDTQAPLFTTVLFLDFPATGSGGELVIFENCSEAQLQALDGIDRKNARQQLPQFDPLLVAPVPGRSCRFGGHLPHAVLGYCSPEHEIWRLSMILAEFE